MTDPVKNRDVRELERMYRMAAVAPWKAPHQRPGPLRDRTPTVPASQMSPAQANDPVHAWIQEAYRERKRAEFAEAQVDRLIGVMRTPWTEFAWWFLVGVIVGGIVVGVVVG